MLPLIGAGRRPMGAPVTGVIDLASWACLVTGGVFCIVGAVGLVRMPDFYTRVHAASVIDTLGAGLVLLGLLLQAGLTLVGAKLAVIGLLLLVASPTATHALVRAAMHRGLEPLLADRNEDPSSKP
jgi:multicomponent Na+:H+ antiporter subunit G